jgi:hypothetical protein
MPTVAINEYLYSDGTGSYTAVKNPKGGNYVPPCQTFSNIPFGGWDRAFTALPVNTKVLINARWIESGCDLLIGTVPGFGAAWLKGGFVESPISQQPVFDTQVFGQLFSKHLGAAINETLSNVGATPPNIESLTNTIKQKLAQKICADQLAKSGGIC